MIVSHPAVRILSIAAIAALLCASTAPSQGAVRHADGRAAHPFASSRLPDLVAPQFRSTFANRALPPTSLRGGPIRRAFSGVVHDTPSWAKLVYVSDYQAGTVTAFYPENLSPCSISGLPAPAGMHEDAQGNLYVALTGASMVVEFGRRCGPVLNVYNDPNCYPVDVTIDPAADVNNGKIFVSNAVCQSGTTTLPGNIVNYNAGTCPPGGCNPNAGSVSDAAESQNFGIAFDSNGDLFSSISFSSTGPGQVDCYPSPVVANEVPLEVLAAPGIGYPGGVNVKANGTRLAVVDQVGFPPGQPPGIDTFAGRCKAGGGGFNLMPANTIVQPSGSLYVDISISKPENFEAVPLDINRTDAILCNADGVTFSWAPGGAPNGSPDDSVPLTNGCIQPLGVTQISPYE